MKTPSQFFANIEHDFQGYHERSNKGFDLSTLCSAESSFGSTQIFFFNDYSLLLIQIIYVTAVRGPNPRV